MRVLFLTHRLPYAPNRGDRIRAWHILHDMARYADVSLFSFVHDSEEEAGAGDAPAARVVTARTRPVSNHIRGALRLPTSRPMTHSLLDAPETKAKLAALVTTNRPDVVLAYGSGMARFAMEPPLQGMPFVLDMVDVDSEKWRRMGERARPPLAWIYRREARTLEAFEREAVLAARTTLVVSHRERDLLASIAPGADVRVVSIGVQLEAFSPPAPSEQPVVVFCGMMDYEPNVDAVTWFATDIWPRVQRVRPDARFVMVGASPTRAVRALAAANRSIDVTGRVDAVTPHLWRAAVAVAPVRLSRGLQNKVLEAFAAGLPTVMTSAVRDGLPPGLERGGIVADDPGAFADAVVSLLALPGPSRRAMAAASGVHACGWGPTLAPLRSILERACGA